MNTATVKHVSGVPDYEICEIAPRRAAYCLLIPVINEGARILTELGRAQRAGWTRSATSSSATAAPPTAA